MDMEFLRERADKARSGFDQLAFQEAIGEIERLRAERVQLSDSERLLLQDVFSLGLDRMSQEGGAGELPQACALLDKLLDLALTESAES